MIKLKSILSESYAWERQAGKPLPTLDEVQAAYKKSLKESPRYHGDVDEIFAEIAAYLADDGHAPSEEAALRALENSNEDYETLIGIFMSDHLTGDEKISMIADLIDIDPSDNDQAGMREAYDAKGVEEAAKPDYIDADGDGDEKESMKKAFADKEEDKDDDYDNDHSDPLIDEETDESVLNMRESFWGRVKGNLHGHEYILREAFRKQRLLPWALTLQRPMLELSASTPGALFFWLIFIDMNRLFIFIIGTVLFCFAGLYALYDIFKKGINGSKSKN